MRIRSSIIIEADLRASLPPHVALSDVIRVRNGFDVFLTGTSPYRGQHWSPSLDCYPKAATYEEWGFFLAALYALDPDTIAGPYRGLADFDEKTRYAFDGVSA